MKNLEKILKVPHGATKAHIGPLADIDSGLADKIPSISLDEVPDYEFDFMLLCASDTSDLKKKCKGFRYVKYDGILWVLLPSELGESQDDVFDEECIEMMEGHNVTVVNQVHLNKKWQAFQFRPYERVHKNDKIGVFS